MIRKKPRVKALILGGKRFSGLALKTAKYLAARQEQARKSGATKLTMREIEAQIAAVRRERTSSAAMLPPAGNSQLYRRPAKPSMDRRG